MSKKILIYLGHPAQYHFFKYIVKNLRKHNNEVLYVIKSKDVLEQLLINDNENFINILPEGRKSSKFGILIGLIKREIRLFKLVKKFKPSLLIGSDPSLSHVGFVLRITRFTIIEDDFDVIPLLAKITYPFTNKIIAPVSCNCGKWNYKKIAYEGYMKLSYLHPKRFSPTKRSSNYFLIRTSGLEAHHDSEINGLNKLIIKKIISILSNYGTVKIISEKPLESDLKPYELKINPNEIHDYLFNAKLLISDSQSMTMEAAMLGVPSIRFSDFAGRIGVLEELEHKYKLTFGIPTNNVEKLFDLLKSLLNDNNLNKTFQNRRAKMLSEKIDVSSFFVWLLNNYPNSFNKIIENPDYQKKFR